MAHRATIRMLLLAALTLTMVSAASRAPAATGACCKSGSCVLATPEQCVGMLGVPLDQSSCAGAVCVECCDGLGAESDQCFENIPLGGCKPLDPKHKPVPGGRCSDGNGNVGHCLRISPAPAASHDSLLLLGAALAALGILGASSRLARRRR